MKMINESENLDGNGWRLQPIGWKIATIKPAIMKAGEKRILVKFGRNCRENYLYN
jgi:hypothetical protein